MSELAIYVTDECWTCDESRRIAAEARQKFPDVDVALVDMNEGPVPQQVFAAPTYLLDGKVIFLGNPRRGDLWQRLSADEQGSVREVTERRQE